MDHGRFDALAKLVAGAASRRSILRGLVGIAAGVTLGLFEGTRSGDFIAKSKKRNRKKKGGRKNAQCKNPNNPCQKGVCKRRKCRTKNQPNGASCGGDATCCDVVCTDTDTDFANCGGCDDACSFATADACVAGECVCGTEPECTGGEVCVGGQCGT